MTYSAGRIPGVGAPGRTNIRDSCWSCRQVFLERHGSALAERESHFQSSANGNEEYSAPYERVFSGV